MSSEFAWTPTASLVDLLLEEQQSLSAVEQFSDYHDSATSFVGRYESLIPTSLPDAGQQFAFRVDLDACTGCKACVTACHSLNGLDEDEAWRTVGLVEGDTPESDESESVSVVHQQTITSACHHCEDPACLAGCPVQAYEKDATTGIVRHLDDQCIGCRYCELMCPYEVPKYSERLGIVRKCDMCHERLAEGEAPACVQGCPNGAISIGIVDAVGDRVGASPPLFETSSGAIPHSELTRPTTRYVSGRSSSIVMDPAALESPRASAAHTPLAIMLVLTQAAIGMVALDGLFAAISHLFEVPRASGPLVITLATAIGLTGLVASVAHLGRPQWAFRAILGLRTSWLSREILVLGGFSGLLVGACALCWIGWGVQSDRLSEGWAWLEELRPAVQGMASAIGLIGLYCSVQIYAVTGRPLWRFDRTAFRFLSTALWVGLAAANLGVVAGGLAPGWVPTALILGLMLLTGLRLRLENEWMVRSDVPKDAIALARSVLLLEGDLASPHRLRRGLLLVAGLLLPMVQLVATGFATPVGFQIGLAIMVMAVGLLSDLVERSLFFRSEAMPSMPGVE